MNFTARKIRNGQVIGVIPFQAADDLAARREANGDIDPLSGDWVECQRARVVQLKVDPEKLVPKEPFTTEGTEEHRGKKHEK